MVPRRRFILFIGGDNRNCEDLVISVNDAGEIRRDDDAAFLLDFAVFEAIARLDGLLISYHSSPTDG